MGSQVYVESASLLSHKENLQNASKNCKDTLDEFEKTANELGSVWKGNTAEGFSSTIISAMNTCRAIHESMENFDNFLAEYVALKEEE